MSTETGFDTRNRRQEAERIAWNAVRREFSPEMEYATTVVEKDDKWVVTILPKGRIRGGGFEVSVAKENMKVLDILHLQ